MRGGEWYERRRQASEPDPSLARHGLDIVRRLSTAAMLAVSVINDCSMLPQL